MEELHSYKKRQNPPMHLFVDDNIRMVAFNFVKNQGQSSLFRLVSNTYGLQACRDIFIDKLKTMIAQKQYKEVGQIAFDLEIFDEFNMHDFILPLLLQDKISIAEDYLNKAHRLQQPVVNALDSFFDRRNSVELNCSKYIAEHNIPEVNLSKLHSKPLSKLVLRLAKKYHIPKELMPNVNRSKNLGAIKFLVNKRYFEKSLNQDSWQEMVRETIPDDAKDLQLELAALCSDYGDYAEAAKWAEVYNIPLKDLPLLVQDYIIDKDTNNDNKESKQAEECWDSDDNEGVHIIPLDDSKIHLVTDKEKFDEMLTDLCSKSIIAFDSEWKPTFCSTNEVALIQLATRTDVYLIDVLVLQLANDDWNSLAKNVFNNSEILKLGFAPTTDIAMFQKSIPALNITHNASILDLQDLWRRIVTIRGFKFPYDEEYSNQNLSCMVKLCLGKKLDKSNQFSNWANRPLRKKQMDYAALDAYCLLEIYDAVEEQLKKINIDLNEILNRLLAENKLRIADNTNRRKPPQYSKQNMDRRTKN